MKSLVLVLLFSLPAVAAAEDPVGVRPNPLIDFEGHRAAVQQVAAIRPARRITEEEFLRLSRLPDTVVLDARSAEMFQRLHVRGAVNLSYPDFTAETLARVIPTKATRVLIYCNNNFVGSQSAFPTKVIQVALNISTFVALHSYGYENVYELGPLLDVKTTELELAGTEALAARKGATL